MKVEKVKPQSLAVKQQSIRSSCKGLKKRLTAFLLMFFLDISIYIYIFVV